MAGRFAGGTGLTDGALEQELDGIGSRLDALEATPPGGAGNASQLPFTPTGTIAATNTQAAVAEVATDAAAALAAGLATKADASALSTLEGEVDTLTTTVAGKADASALATLEGEVDALTLVVADKAEADEVIAIPAGSADGDILVRVGGVWTRLPVGSNSEVLQVVTGAPAWAPAPASGGPAAISYIEDFATGRGYQHPDDVFAGQTTGTIVALHMPRRSTESSPLRHLCGTNGQFGGGVSLCISGEHYTFRLYANGGSIRTGVSACPPTTRKWNMVTGRYDGTLAAGADLLVRLDINAGQVGGTYAAGVGGAPNAGVDFFVGARDGGVDSPALYDRIAGVGWVNRYVTDEELAEWYAACVAAGTLVDIPSGGGLGGGWRVTGGADPGATWAPFAGATSLTRVGTALTPGEDTAPNWK